MAGSLGAAPLLGTRMGRKLSDKRAAATSPHLSTGTDYETVMDLKRGQILQCCKMR